MGGCYSVAPEHGPRIAAIVGGTGLSTLLRGLKLYTKNLTAIVTMAVSYTHLTLPTNSRV